jgi:hypothetical protein
MVAAFICWFSRANNLIRVFPFQELSSREHILYEDIEILLELNIISFGVDKILLKNASLFLSHSFQFIRMLCTEVAFLIIWLI